MGAIQPWHIILVVIVFLILFGSKKLPDAARGLGRSMRIFKSEVKEMQSDDKSDADIATPTQQLSSQPQPNSSTVASQPSDATQPPKSEPKSA